MASAHSLLSLLNQLQLMENSLTNFMLETVLKLQSLTDTKVFLLLENQERRRYCGTKELVRCFEKNTLTRNVADVEVELDNGGALVEKSQRKRFNAGFSETLIEPIAWQANSQNHDEDECGQPKRRRIDNVTMEDSTLASVGYDEASSSCKEVPEYVVSDEENVDATVDATVDDMDDYACDNKFVPLAEGLGTVSCYDRSNSMFFNALANSDLEEKKLDALVSIENPWTAYEKGSLENKLLKSVLYSVGKNIALNCPHADLSLSNSVVQTYFSHQCDLFMSTCSRLLVDKNKKPKGSPSPSVDDDCLKGYSVAGFMRRSIRDGFKRVASRYKTKT